MIQPLQEFRRCLAGSLEDYTRANPDALLVIEPFQRFDTGVHATGLHATGQGPPNLETIGESVAFLRKRARARMRSRR